MAQNYNGRGMRSRGGGGGGGVAVVLGGGREGGFRIRNISEKLVFKRL